MIQPGDIVRLKSGGPNMTVDLRHYTAAGPTWRCTWFAGETRHSEDFEESLIEKVPKP